MNSLKRMLAAALAAVVMMSASAAAYADNVKLITESDFENMISSTYDMENIKTTWGERFISDSDGEISIPVTIADTSGSGSKNRLFRRGFVLEKAQVYDSSELILVDKTGNFIPSVFSEMELYDDGSIKWALLSFVCSLERNEQRQLYIVNSGAEKTFDYIGFENNSLENERINISVTENGAEGISFDNEILFDRIYLYYNNTELTFSGYDILQKNALYTKIRLNANSNGKMRGEMYVTLWQKSDDIDIEYRFTALKDIVVTNMGCALECAENTTINSSKEIVKINGVSVGASVVSQDVERFRGAVSKDADTGFFKDGNIIRFSPIINNTEFTWYDGLTRTNHIYITSNNGEDVLSSLKIPTSVIISPEQFLKSGIIQSTSTNAVLDRITESLEYAYDKRNGCFEAGYIPWIIDKVRMRVGSPTVQHGETDYNLALLQLSQGNAMLYNMISESGECRADVCVYKGGIMGAYGAVRYKTGSHLETGSSTFKTSHPYYGEASGLYMAYLLSGNEYLRETFIEAADHICSNIEQGTGELGKYPSMVSWNSGTAKKANYGESRYIIQIRPLMLANALTGDEKYKTAAHNIVEWAKEAQSNEGYWYQAYYDDKTPLTQAGQTQAAVKNYIMLYGARGLSYLTELEHNETALGVLEKFSDFLCSEIQNYGAGLWSPTGNIEVYEENEDGTRGKSAMQDIMAAEILFRTYTKTNNEKYLNGFLKCLNAWVCALGPGGLPASVSYLKEYYDGSVGYAQASQNLTVISFIGEVEKFLRDNRQLIYKKGFGQLCEVFNAGSKVTVPENISGYTYPELTSSLYNDNAFFAMNVNGKRSGKYYKEYTSVALGNNLWSGVKNVVDSDGNVSLSKNMNQFDIVSAVRCPITLRGNNSDTEVYVNEYNEDKIVITLETLEKLQIDISDGVFDTKSGYYSYKVQAVSEGFVVIVENSDEGIPKSGVITIDVSVNPITIAKLKLLNSDLEQTEDLNQASYISNIELQYNDAVEAADLLVAQYNKNKVLEKVNIEKAVLGVCSKRIELNSSTDICKVMVWDNLKPMTSCVIIEGMNKNDL